MTDEFIVVDTYRYIDDQIGVQRLGLRVRAERYEIAKELLGSCFENNRVTPPERNEVEHSGNFLRNIMNLDEVESWYLSSKRKNGPKTKIVVIRN